MGAIYGLVAIGYTLVYGIIGIINFAHSEIFMIGAFMSIIAFLVLGAVGEKDYSALVSKLKAGAVVKAGGIDTKKVSAALRTGDYDTVLGKISFDKKGDVTAPGYVFYKWTKGKYDYLN